MKVTVRYFAVLRDRRGLDSEVIETEAQTAGELAASLISAHSLGLPAALIRTAVGDSFVAEDHPIREGDRIVLIPPVAGG